MNFNALIKRIQCVLLSDKALKNALAAKQTQFARDNTIITKIHKTSDARYYGAFVRIGKPFF